MTLDLTAIKARAEALEALAEISESGEVFAAPAFALPGDYKEVDVAPLVRDVLALVRELEQRPVVTTPSAAQREAVARAICRAWFYCDLDKPDGIARWNRERNQRLMEADAAWAAVIKCME